MSPALITRDVTSDSTHWTHLVARTTWRAIWKVWIRRDPGVPRSYLLCAFKYQYCCKNFLSPILIPKSVTYCTCHSRNVSRKHRRKNARNVIIKQRQNFKQRVPKPTSQPRKTRHHKNQSAATGHENTEHADCTGRSEALFSCDCFAIWSGDKIRFLAVTKKGFRHQLKQSPFWQHSFFQMSNNVLGNVFQLDCFLQPPSG